MDTATFAEVPQGCFFVAGHGIVWLKLPDEQASYVCHWQNFGDSTPQLAKVMWEPDTPVRVVSPAEVYRRIHRISKVGMLTRYPMAFAEVEVEVIREALEAFIALYLSDFPKAADGVLEFIDNKPDPRKALRGGGLGRVRDLLNDAKSALTGSDKGGPGLYHPEVSWKARLARRLLQRFDPDDPEMDLIDELGNARKHEDTWALTEEKLPPGSFFTREDGTLWFKTGETELMRIGHIDPGQFRRDDVGAFTSIRSGKVARLLPGAVVASILNRV